jgi:CubicO group peptidase (beta-lactamase class C family)
MNIQNLLEKLIRSGVEEGAFPSAVAAVGKRGETLARASAGRLCAPDGPLADFGTRYDMASVTKILAPTMLALRALEEGDLTLIDDVGRFFDAPEDKKSISVLQLMTHTGGFCPHFDLRAEVKGPDDALSAILRHPLEGTPGDMPRYSCMGYIVLGKMLEALYGEPLDALARKQVFGPLGMIHTSYLPKDGNIAATENDPKTGVALVGAVHDENARFLGGVSANAGVFSDIEDMAKFAAMLAQNGGGFLSPAALRAAIRNRTPGFDQHRGLGFQLGGTWGCFLGELTPPEAFGHTGYTGTSIAVDPTTGFWAVLLTNRVNPTRGNLKILRFRRKFHNALYAACARD